MVRTISQKVNSDMWHTIGRIVFSHSSHKRFPIFEKLDGLLAQDLGDVVIDVLRSNNNTVQPNHNRIQGTGATLHSKTKTRKRGQKVEELSDVVFVPTDTHSSQGESQLSFFLRSMKLSLWWSTKLRSPTMIHLSRTHTVALDQLFDSINFEPKIQIEYVDQNRTRNHADEKQCFMSATTAERHVKTRSKGDFQWRLSDGESKTMFGGAWSEERKSLHKVRGIWWIGGTWMKDNCKQPLETVGDPFQDQEPGGFMRFNKRMFRWTQQAGGAILVTQWWENISTPELRNMEHTNHDSQRKHTKQMYCHGKCSRRHRWQPPSILVRIIWRIRRSTQNSRKFKCVLAMILDKKCSLLSEKVVFRGHSFPRLLLVNPIDTVFWWIMGVREIIEGWFLINGGGTSHPDDTPQEWESSGESGGEESPCWSGRQDGLRGGGPIFVVRKCGSRVTWPRWCKICCWYFNAEPCRNRSSLQVAWIWRRSSKSGAFRADAADVVVPTTQRRLQSTTQVGGTLGTI